METAINTRQLFRVMCAAVVFAALPVFSGIYVWTDTLGDSDWNNQANWDPNTGVPSAGDTASFTKDATIPSAIALASGTLTVSVSGGVTLNFNGAISGGDGCNMSITSPTTSASGTINFNASSSFTGELRINYGFVHGKADYAFGLPSSQSSSRVYLNANNKYVLLYLDGIKNPKKICQSCNDANTGYKATLLFNGNNTIGAYESSGTVRLSVQSGKTVVTNGINNPAIAIYNIAASSELIVSNTPATKINHYEEGGPGPVVLACANNVITTGTYPLRVPYRCEVNGAFKSTTDIIFGSKNTDPYIDLNGTTQTVARIREPDKRTTYPHLGTVKGANGGLLTMTSNSNFTNSMAFVEKTSLEVAVPAARTVTLRGRSTTSGELIAKSGTTFIMADGGWTEGTVWVKDGAVLKFEDVNSFTKNTTLRLGGGTVELPSGITLVGALIDESGVSRAPGLYAATATDGATAINGLAGDGFVQVLPPPPGTEVTWIWNGSANDGRFSTPGNWEDPEGTSATAENFNVSSVDNVFRFPSQAAVTVDASVYAKRLLFDGEGDGTATFTPSGDGAINVVNGEISVTNTATAAKTVDFDVPVRFLGEMRLGILAGDLVRFDGPLNSIGTGKLVKRGYGKWHIVGDANRIYGDVVNSNGVLSVSGADPLGGSGELRNYQWNVDHSSYIILDGAVVNRQVSTTPQGSYGDVAMAITSTASTSNTINGMVKSTASHLRISPGANSQIIVPGGASIGNLFICNGSNFGITRFTDVPINTDRAYYADGDNKSICAFAVPGNKFNNSLFICTTLRTEVDNALKNTHYFKIGKNYGRVDLWGTTQHVANAYVSVFTTNAQGIVTKITGQSTAMTGEDGFCGGNIKSDRPGAYIAFVGSSTYALTPTFGGSVSFERAGTGTNVIHRANTATGEVFVTGGKLRFAAPGETWMHNGVAQTYKSDGGAWAGERVTVTNGVLAIGHSKAFPKMAQFRLGGGTLELDAGVVQRIYSLELLVNGEWKRQRLGIWGAMDNENVPAATRIPLITGGGVLKVMGDGWGTKVILK